jgi:hypothetical protein
MNLVLVVEMAGNLIVSDVRVIDIINVINNGIVITLVCWFGVRATKYANITNIPPT